LEFGKTIVQVKGPDDRKNSQLVDSTPDMIRQLTTVFLGELLASGGNQPDDTRFEALGRHLGVSCLYILEVGESNKLIFSATRTPEFSWDKDFCESAAVRWIINELLTVRTPVLCVSHSDRDYTRLQASIQVEMSDIEQTLLGIPLVRNPSEAGGSHFLIVSSRAKAAVSFRSWQLAPLAALGHYLLGRSTSASVQPVE